MFVISFCFHIFPGLSLYNISLSYEQAGDFDRALECARESLRVFQTALPPGHQNIVNAEKMILYVERAMGRR